MAPVFDDEPSPEDAAAPPLDELSPLLEMGEDVEPDDDDGPGVGSLDDVLIPAVVPVVEAVGLAPDVGLVESSSSSAADVTGDSKHPDTMNSRNQSRRTRG